MESIEIIVWCCFRLIKLSRYWFVCFWSYDAFDSETIFYHFLFLFGLRLGILYRLIFIISLLILLLLLLRIITQFINFILLLIDHFILIFHMLLLQLQLQLQKLFFRYPSKSSPNISVTHYHSSFLNLLWLFYIAFLKIWKIIFCEGFELFIVHVHYLLLVGLWKVLNKWWEISIF